VLQAVEPLAGLAGRAAFEQGHGLSSLHQSSPTWSPTTAG
jgi:hypothetical protein